MQIKALGHEPTKFAADLLVVPHFLAGKKPAVAAVDSAMAGLLSEVIAEEKLAGKEGETTTLRTSGKIAAKKVTLLGCGAKPFGASAARRWGARAAAAARAAKAKTIALVVPECEDIAAVSQALAEGLFLGDYRFLKYKDEDNTLHAENALSEVVLLVPPKSVGAFEKGIGRGQRSSRAAIFARGLVNEPALEMTPGKLVELAKAIADGAGPRLQIEVFDKDDLKKMGCGGILAVARGSDEPPYMVHMTYKPKKKAKKRIAIVGKGITFDSGGLSIKPSDAMEDMKIDMAGCAAMLGIMSALPELAPDVEVHGISGICENMPSGKAIRPGDVVRTMGGKTIEILNTDAEGRVTLADTLHYATTLKPDAIIDLATLTGACMVALGEEVAGLMTNRDKLGEKLLAAATASGEMMARLPLVNEYRELVKSRVADLRNISTSRYGGAITAGLFLEEFVGSTPWAHIDMAGPAWAERESVPYQPLGATGYGVRTLLTFIESL